MTAVKERILEAIRWIIGKTTYYVPYIVSLLFTIGSAIFNPVILLYLYDSVCHDLYPEASTDDSTPSTTTPLYYFNSSSHSFAANLTNLTLGPELSCTNLTENDQNTIQKYATNYLVLMKLLQSVPAFVVCLFCGGWIDRIGQRLPMMLACMNSVLIATMYCFIDGFNGYAIPGIMVGTLLGAILAPSALVYVAVETCIASRTSAAERTRQIGLIMATNAGGLVLGTLLMAATVDSVPFFVMFIFIDVFFLICFLFVYFTWPEHDSEPTPDGENPTHPEGSGEHQGEANNETTTDHAPVVTYVKHNEGPRKSHPTVQVEVKVEEPPKEIAEGENKEQHLSKHREMLKNATSFYQIGNLKDTLGTVFKKRPNNRRRYILSILACIMLKGMCKSGETNLVMFFVRHSPLDWTKSQYGFLLSFEAAVSGITLLLFLPLLLYRLKLSDSTAIVGITVVKVFGLCYFAMSYQTWMVYVAVFFMSLYGIAISCFRSMFSKLVDKEETGRCFILLACAQVISDFAGTVIFTRLYYIGLSYGTLFGRSLPFLVMAVMYIFIAVIASLVNYAVNQQQQQQEKLEIRRASRRKSSRPGYETIGDDDEEQLSPSIYDGASLKLEDAEN